MNISLATRVLRAIGLLAVSFCTGWTVPRRRCLSSARTAWGPLLPLLALLLAAGPVPVASAAAPVVSIEASLTGLEDTPFLLAGSTFSVSTLAGSSTAGNVNGTGTAAQFNGPQGLGVDAAGNVYVADYGNNRIRKITPAGVVTTLANGTGTAVFSDLPSSVTVDTAGNVYVTEQGQNRIQKITSAGVVTTLAGGGYGFADGTGTAALFRSPCAVAVDAAGYLYVASEHRIRKISPGGLVTTLAGSGTGGFADATGTAAMFNGTNGVAVDAAGYVYVGDATNNRIRKITPEGVVTTLAGSSTAGFLDGAATTARFSGLIGVAVDAAGNVYGADGSNNRIRKIALPRGVTVSDADGGTLTVALGVSNGTLTATLTGGATVSAGALASGSVTLSGTSTQLNAALDTLNYQGTTNTTGADTLTATVSDGGTPVTATATITVTAVNDAPVAAVSTVTSIVEDVANDINTGTQVLALVAGFSDVDSGAVKGLAVTAVDTANGTWYYSTNSGGAWTTLTGVSTSAARLLRGDITSYQVRFVPNANYNGTATLTYQAWDQTSGSAGGAAAVTTNGGSTAYSSNTGTATVTVTAVNDAPTLAAISNPAAILEEAGAQTVSLTGIAAGGSETQVLTVTATSNNTSLIPNPTVTYTSAATTGSLSYTPVANANGTAIITVTVTDDGGTDNSGVATTTQTFTVTVTAVNDAPTLAAISNPAAILEDASAQTVSLTGIAAGGGETQVLTVTATSSNTALIPNPTVTYTSAGTTGSLSYTPVANANGTAIITVTVTDNGGTDNSGVATTTQTFTVAVTAVNDAPTLAAIADPTAILEDAGAQTVSLTGIAAGGSETQVLTGFDPVIGDTLSGVIGDTLIQGFSRL